MLRGANNKSKLNVSHIDSNNELNLLLDAKNNSFYDKNNSFFEKGIYHFTGEIHYSGSQWSFVPQISNKNNKFESALNKRLVYLSDKNLNTSLFPLLILIGKVYDIFIFILIALPITCTILRSLKKHSINNEILCTIIFFLLFLFSKSFLNFTLGSFHGLWPLCLALIFLTLYETYLI